MGDLLPPLHLDVAGSRSNPREVHSRDGMVLLTIEPFRSAFPLVRESRTNQQERRILIYR